MQHQQSPVPSHSTSIPTLAELQHAFLASLSYYEKHQAALTRSSKKQIETLRQLASKPHLTAQQLGVLAGLPVTNGNKGFRPIEPSSEAPIDTTQLQYGQATVEWYFLTGNCGSVAFTFILFAIPCATPPVAEQLGLTGPAGAYIYCLAGGYGPRAKPGTLWNVFPTTYLTGHYASTSRSTFAWTGIVPPNSPVQQASLTSSTMGQFNLQLSWVDAGQTQHTVNATLHSRIPPTFNGPDGCVPCASGLGTLYWSYTNMASTLEWSQKAHEAKTPTSGTASGSGWFDHQWLQAGVVRSLILRSVLNLSRVSKPASALRWVWLNLRDEVRNEQFMVVINPKARELIQVNHTYTSTSFNRYTDQKGVELLKPKQATLYVSAARQIKPPGSSGPYTFPTQYYLTLTGLDSHTDQANTHVPPPPRKYVLTAEFGDSLLRLPNGAWNWEGSGSLVDVSTGQQVGVGFLESNQMAAGDTLFQDLQRMAGLSAATLKPFKPVKTSAGTSILSVLYLLVWPVLLGLLIGLVVWAVKATKGKAN